MKQVAKEDEREKSTNCMGEMIEQIWSRKTSAGPRADESSVIRFGPVPQITIHGVIAAVALRWRTRSVIMASPRNSREENDHDILCWFGRFTERDFDLRC